MWESVFAASLLAAVLGTVDADLAAPGRATGYPAGLVRRSPAHGFDSAAHAGLAYTPPPVQARHSAQSLSRKKAPAKPRKPKK